jgi:hypothetical protein
VACFYTDKPPIFFSIQQHFSKENLVIVEDIPVGLTHFFLRRPIPPWWVAFFGFPNSLAKNW